MSRKTLKKFGARVTSDESRIVLPVCDVGGQVVGFHSVSLLHSIPQVLTFPLADQKWSFDSQAVEHSHMQYIVGYFMWRGRVFLKDM